MTMTTTALLIIVGVLLLAPPVATLTLAPFVPSKILALGVALALQPQTLDTPFSEDYSSDNVPIIEVVKVYGKLAGSECYGKQAPKGSSCQINLKDLEQRLSGADASDTAASAPSKQVFETKLKTMEFLWPLKPFGVDKSPSLVKTAVMNKGAETMVFMQELEARGLYDPRNPTGPLPTSLRPSLNKALQAEGIIDQRAIDRTYEVLFGVSDGRQAGIFLEGAITGQGNGPLTDGFLDYYDFLKLFGPNSITWPKHSNQ